MASNAGRKNKYESHVKPYLAEIEEMCKTMTEKQIADRLGVSYTSSWSRYKIDYPELREAIKKGRQNLVGDLRSSLIKKAKGYEYTETKVVTEAVKLPTELYEVLLEAGFSDKDIEQAQIVRTEVYRKQAAPDVAALNLALKNYDSKNWSNDPAAHELKVRELELKEKAFESGNW